MNFFQNLEIYYRTKYVKKMCSSFWNMMWPDDNANG
jgi:hypothetical protein